MHVEPKVDLCFHVSGRNVPVDHGFGLYGAVSRVIPGIHEDDATGIKLLRGRYIGEGLLDISPVTELILRLPVSSIPSYLNLAGKALDVLGCSLRIGVPRTRSLIPSVVLYAQLVTTRNGQDQDRFEEEIKKQLQHIGVNGKFTTGKRRTFQIHGKQVVGYSLLLDELTAEESITVQERGLGGRRKMGCGFFETWRQ